MLKVRIIPCLLFQERTIVKSNQFNEMRMVGDPTTVARVFNERNADELIFLDITASRKNKGPNFKALKDIAAECFMPLTIGGGISKMSHVDKLFKIGADKIAINTSLIKNPTLIREAARKYGSQAIVASIDVKRTDDGNKVFVCDGTEETMYTAVQFAKIAEKLGAGEILLNSIDRDGTQKGYDLDLIKEVVAGVNIPVIAAGGCGKLQDFVDAVKIGGADAVCAASIFYYVGESIITSKKYMNEKGIPMRII